jgi:hypothetical protein
MPAPWIQRAFGRSSAVYLDSASGRSGPIAETHNGTAARFSSLVGFAAWCSRERRCWFSYLQIQNADVGDGSIFFFFVQTFLLASRSEKQ